MKNHPLLTKEIVAILCITAIVITCIFHNIDGAIIAGAVTAVAGLGGYLMGKAKKRE